MKSNPTILGTGLIALDVICEASHRFCAAGGSCGNVLAILGYFGWDAYPISTLSHDFAGEHIRAEFRNLGVSLEFLCLGDPAPTPVIFQQFLEEHNGGRTHRFSKFCPICGHESPEYIPVSDSAVTSALPALPDAQVCYIDRATSSSLELARNAAAKGSLVIFEPSDVNDTAIFSELCAHAHVIKYSHDRLSSINAYLTDSPLLEIQTLGRHGLRFRSGFSKWRAKEWQHIPAFEQNNAVDAAGSGDWCTAGLLHVIGAGGLDSLLVSTERDLKHALMFGQALAALNCGFIGARRLMRMVANDDLITYAKILAKTGAPPTKDLSSAKPVTLDDVQVMRCFC